LTDPSAPDDWPEDQLVKYGICGHQYRDARVQPDESGKARLEFVCGTIGTLIAENNLKGGSRAAATDRKGN
jgi:hypothetical protein